MDVVGTSGGAGSEAPVHIRAPYLRCAGVDYICYVSPPMRDIFTRATILHGERAVPVLLEGETGTGKDVAARYIHHGSAEATTPFVALNCATLDPNNCERELFGFASGAFGTPQGKRGKIDLAQGGTLFLDHVDQLSPEAQAKLLRTIEENGFYRVGGLRRIDLDIRVIAATNVDLPGQVEKGAFRADLFYRLRGAAFFLPPLRRRKESIVPLAELFLTAAAAERGKRFQRITGAAANILRAHHWPGNIRELKQMIELVVLMRDDTALRPGHLGELRPADRGDRTAGSGGSGRIDIERFSLPPEGLPLQEFQNRIMLRAFRMHDGNKTRTAKYLGISRRTLDYRLKNLL